MYTSIVYAPQNIHGTTKRSLLIIRRDKCHGKKRKFDRKMPKFAIDVTNK